MLPGSPTYSGGLGVLAGDVVRAAADAGYPMAGVTLLYRDGYFRQHLDASGGQHEEPQSWRPESSPRAAAGRGRRSRSPAARSPSASGAIDVAGVDGARRPGLLPRHRPPGERRGRTRADARALRRRRALPARAGSAARPRHASRCCARSGHERIATLPHERGPRRAARPRRCSSSVRATPHGLPTYDDLARVRERCVFTTHTPVPGRPRPLRPRPRRTTCSAPSTSRRCARSDLPDHDALNMTHLALRASRFTNARRDEARRGLARDVPGRRDPRDHQRRPRRHLDLAAVARRCSTGTSRAGAATTGSCARPSASRSPEIADAHAAAKHALVERVAHATGKLLDPNRFTIGIARRATAYKRNDLILRDAERAAPRSRSGSAASRSSSAAKRTRATGTARR